VSRDVASLKTSLAGLRLSTGSLNIALLKIVAARNKRALRLSVSNFSAVLAGLQVVFLRIVFLAIASLFAKVVGVRLLARVAEST
jgi:hypothetical protein